MGTINQINNLQVGTGKIAVGTGGNNNKCSFVPTFAIWPKCIATQEVIPIGFFGSHLGSVGLFGCRQYAAVDGKESANPDAGNTVFLRPMVPIALIKEAGSIKRSGGSTRI